MTPPALSHSILNKRIVICAGPGGVGKTTTAASLAIHGAQNGKKAIVITVDPAKRLATCLGLDELGHSRQQINHPSFQNGGTLFAMMLDQQKAFDEVVSSHARDPDAAKRVFSNNIYQQISGSLAGTQEYAATTKLYELAQEDEYDFIVVDTPPTTHALDFLDAPEKLAAAIDSPAAEWFRKFKLGNKSLIGRAGNVFLKRIRKFTGGGFLDDIATFFVEFGEVMSGFRDRAARVTDLLRSEDVGFVLVTAPDQHAVSEALSFHDRLREKQMPFSYFVANQIHTADTAGISPEVIGQLPPEVQETVREQLALVERDQNALVPLVDRNAPIAKIPVQTHDLQSIESLAILGNLAASPQV